MKTSLLRAAAFVCAAALTVLLQAQSLVIFDASTPVEKIRSLDGGKFQQTPDGLLVETQGAQAQGKTVYPGIAILGDWDLSQFNAVEVEAGHRDHHANFSLRLRLASGGEGNLCGTTDALVALADVGTEPGIGKVIVPIACKRFETTGMRRAPWDGSGEANTLKGTKINSVGLYMAKPLLDWKWTVKRVTLKKVDLAEEAKKLAAPRPFKMPTQLDYYRFFDPNPVWEKMTPEEFFPFIDCYGQFKFKEWPGKIHSDAELQQARVAEEKDLAAHPGPKGWDEFGGWADGPKFDATGHFRVQKINGKWWMIDPLGNLYWSHGPVRVNASSAVTPIDGRKHYFEALPAEDSPLAEFYHTNDAVLKHFYGDRETYDFSSANAWRKYGGEGWWEKYAEMCHRRLKSWGMNTIANSSDIRIAMQNKTPFCDRFVMDSPELAGATPGFWANFRDPFHPEFRKDAHAKLLAHKAELESPYCFGFFVDNELHWGSRASLGEWTIQSPADQPAKKVMQERMQAKYGTIEKLNAAWGTKLASWDAWLENRTVPAGANEDCRDFAAAVVREYFAVIHDEFRKVVPNTLYLGCRYAGGAEPDFLKIAAEYCDALSFNIYRFTLDEFKLPEGVDKPILVGEFHFGALDRGMFHWTLIGVKDQKARGQAYFNYVESALRHPNFIGVHWHQYSEQATTGRFDGEDFQNGFVDVCDTPYPETIEKIREIGYKMYEMRWSK